MLPHSLGTLRPFLPALLLLTLGVGCSGDDVVGPNRPDPPTPATTGRIVVSVLANRPELELSLTIGGAGTWIFRPDDAVSVDGLVPGQYQVSLALPAALGETGLSCQIRDGNRRIAVVRPGETTAVQYQISCGSVTVRPRDQNPS